MKEIGHNEEKKLDEGRGLFGETYLAAVPTRRTRSDIGIDDRPMGTQ